MSLYGGIKLVGRPDPENVMRLDLLPMEAINDMTRVGFAIDREWFWELSSRLDREMRELRAQICSYIPPEKLDEFIARSGIDEPDEDGPDELKDWSPMNVDSNEQLATLFFEVLGIGKGKQLKLTKGGTRISTGKKQLELLKCNHPPEKPCTTCHPVVKPTLEYRERQKLKSTYTDSLPIKAKFHPRGDCPVCELHHKAETWRIHTQILTTRTTTGRLASKAPNLQNISTRTELGREVRKGFIASPGTELVSVDFSQMEVRMTAHYTRDPNLIRIYHTPGADVHVDTARRAFGLGPDEKPDKLTQRDPSKTTTFLVIYSGTELALFDTLAYNFGSASLPIPTWLTVDWCVDFIDRFLHELYPTIPAYWDVQDYRARRYGIGWTLFGRVRRVPEVSSVHQRIQNAGLRQIRNQPIQGTCADINRLAIYRTQEEVVKPLQREAVYCRPLMSVHDEWIGEVEEGYGELVKNLTEIQFAETMRDEDTGEYMCVVPIEAEGKSMQRWSK